MKPDIIQLSPNDVVRERPFAHPGRLPADINSLRYMVDQLCMFLERPERYTQEQRPIIVHHPARERFVYRLLVARPEQLVKPSVLTFVGFLGQRRREANVALADEFDRILISEIPAHPGLLSYSTMALISGNYSNLVLFTDDGAKAHWSRSQAHAQAVGRLAPDYYRSVRLYNGVLPGGVHDSRTLRVTRVKYFDYAGDSCWRAVREFPEERDGSV